MDRIPNDYRRRVRVSDGLQSVRRFNEMQYEEQLISLGLGKAQIEGQTLQELKDSLERVNDAINNHESFPKFYIAISGSHGVPYVTQSNSKANYQITILPVLLERKKLILERIRSSEDTERVESLQDLINKKVPDKDIQEKLARELNNIISESQNLKEQYQQVINSQSKQIEKSESEKLMLSMKLWERRSKILRSFLERESAATIIGVILLLLIALAHVFGLGLAAFGLDVTIPETLDSAFLLILGYFFGQSTSQESTARNTQSSQNIEE